jgi:hypothetical protein
MMFGGPNMTRGEVLECLRGLCWLIRRIPVRTSPKNPFRNVDTKLRKNWEAIGATSLIESLVRCGGRVRENLSREKVNLILSGSPGPGTGTLNL